MSTEIDDRLRHAHARIDAGPAPATTRARLETLIAGSRPLQSVTPSPRRSRPRRGAVAAIAAGLAAAGLVVLALLPGSGGVSGPASASAACITRGPAQACGVALRGVAKAWSVPGSGDIIYQRGSWAVTQFSVTPTTDRQESAAGAPAPNTIVLAAAKQPFVVARTGIEEQWIAPNGSGRTSRSKSGDITLATSQDRAAWEAAGRPDLEKLIPRLAAEHPLSSDFPADSADERLLGANGLYGVLPHDDDPLRVIPRERSALAAWLHDKAGQRRGRSQHGCTANRDGCSAATRRLIDDTVVSDIETLLAYPSTPAALRATLVTVLTERPGTQSLGLIRDPAGQDVAAVKLGDGMHDGDGANLIAFDPTSGELRGIGTAVLGGGVRWARTFAIVSRRVSAVGDAP